MLTRRTLIKSSSAAACLLTVNPAFALGAPHGPRRVVTVTPMGAIRANATVWLDSGPHRVCLWSACAGPVPSVGAAVQQLLGGVIEISIEGQTVARASTRAWHAGHRIALPGVDAGLWIQTSPRPSEAVT